MSIIRRSYLLADAIFDPTTIASLAHRYRASSAKIDVGGGGGAQPGDGDPVGRLFDEIGSADLVAISSGARPTAVDNGGVLIVDFDGIDDQMNITSGLAISAPYTVVAVFYWPGRAAISVYDPLWRIWAGSFATLSSQLLLDYDSTGQDVYVVNDSVNYGDDLADPTARWLNLEVTAADDGSETYLDGSAFASDANGVSHTTPNEVKVGGIGVASRYYSGALAELLLFDARLTTQERSDLQSYLTATYGGLT